MITYNVVKYLSTEKTYFEGVCLSNDAKPTKNSTGGKLANGSKLLEMDTSTLYIYDEKNNVWRAWG